MLDAALLDRLIKAYDVRGVVPDDLSPEVARLVGAAFAHVVGASTAHGGPGTIVVGNDMRPSGPELVAAFAEGVTSQGVDVLEIGLASTDQLYYAAGSLDLPGAMFTASHNPAQYNGIKLCRAGASPVGQDTGLREIKDLVLAWSQSGDPCARRSGGQRHPPRRPRRLRRLPQRPRAARREPSPRPSSSTRATAWAATPCPRSSPGCR